MNTIKINIIYQDELNLYHHKLIDIESENQITNQFELSQFIYSPSGLIYLKSIIQIDTIMQVNGFEFLVNGNFLDTLIEHLGFSGDVQKYKIVRILYGLNPEYFDSPLDSLDNKLTTMEMMLKTMEYCNNYCIKNNQK